MKKYSFLLCADTTELDQTLNVTGATIENSFLADVKASNQEEVTYFLIGAIVATVVLVSGFIFPPFWTSQRSHSASWYLQVIVLLVLLVLRKRIKLVIALFREAGHAVHAMPLLVLVPLLTFLALAVTTAIWIYGSLYIFTAGDAVEDSGTKFIKYKPDTFLWWMRW